MKEVWKYIPGCEGRLEVSNMGKYRKVGTKQEKKGCRVNRGDYLCVHYKDNNGKDCWTQMHRLVAKVFVPNERNAPQVDHIDSNPRNNRADNLRWVFPKENVNNTSSQIKRKEPSLFKKRPQKFCSIVAVFPNGARVYFSSKKRASENLGCCISTIDRVLKGVQPTYKGISLTGVKYESFNIF